MNNKKFIIVTGGVISGIGKGVSTASVASLLKEDYKITPIKCDGYLNTDPGTINPIEHGEVFVLDDGSEVDMDFGHYERFLNLKAKRKWNITMGKIYKDILDNERKGVYLGKTVQMIPHVTDAIKKTIYNIGEEEKSDIIVVEIGGTVGDLENALFIEAVRQMKLEVGKNNICFIHLTYIPKPSGVNEQKSKPTQQSIKTINEMGIYPDLIIARCHEDLTPSIKKKISLYCNIEEKYIVTSPDLKSVYELPKVFYDQNLTKFINNHLKINAKPNINFYKEIVSSNKHTNKLKPINITICGKYTELEDSYASITETLNIISIKNRINLNIIFNDTSSVDETNVKNTLKDMHGVIIPGGFGSRAIEGKIKIIQYCRENNIPFFGICYGLQLAVIEFARNICNIKDAHTTEVFPASEISPVICLLEEQKNIKSLGGSMRLGELDVKIKPNTLAHNIFKTDNIKGRFRHRYEVNEDYVNTLEKNGLVFSGYSEKDGVMQMIELNKHPFFMASQYHPELTSTLDNPSIILNEFIIASLRYSKNINKK